ncbi:uncharacterized protein [Dendrobates tinctorius]|uniref:uncharacterized protein isoform X1 n=1 Tax=Dendrobates tinctorius TaxID=92724 RepID=UPI003CCA1320
MDTCNAHTSPDEGASWGLARVVRTSMSLTGGRRERKDRCGPSLRSRHTLSHPSAVWSRAKEKDFRLRVILPTDLQLQNARLECSWQLKKVLQGYRHIVKQVHDRCMDIDILC